MPRPTPLETTPARERLLSLHHHPHIKYGAGYSPRLLQGGREGVRHVPDPGPGARLHERAGGRGRQDGGGGVVVPGRLRTLAIALVVMGAVSLACMSAGGAQPEAEPSPTPTSASSVSTREVLAAAAKAMDALQSGSLKWETTSSEGGDPTEVFRIDFEVDFIVGERYMSVSTFDGGGMEFEITSINIGRDGYTQSPRQRTPTGSGSTIETIHAMHLSDGSSVSSTCILRKTPLN